MVTSARLILPGGRRWHTRWLRVLRAVWRDSSALWREFRVSILVFVLAVFGGGWLYGELSVLAGYPRLPYIRLPYMMLNLMVLQPPGEPPSQPELILFWYVMPILALYSVGRGAADFVRLFFNRSERRNAWEEAVASTYRQHVIVLGIGHVGLRVVRTLVGMGFDVIAIEAKLKADIEDEMHRLGVPVIVADGRSPQALEQAGVRHAHAFIACTASDQVNLEAIMRARDLNADMRIVARMWDDQYANQLKRFMGVQAVLSASDLAAPAFAGSAVGVEITQTIQVHGVDYSMLRLQVEAGSFLDGGAISELQAANQMDIVLHGRGGDVEVQPEGGVRVQSGDTLVIFARHDQVINLVERNRRGGKK
jgi:Trk K+ transport system NAD-binding subunit